MLPVRSPSEAYARIDFDARVEGADPQELVGLCYERLTLALGAAIHAAQSGDNALKSRSLTRALSAVTLLQMGVSGEDGVAGALHQFYASARRSILDSAVRFDAARMAEIRSDFCEIASAMRDAV
ncbi:hypothetical protein GCM10011371_30690 [Novosphingobium marinum]|uniref:Flagellar protein FliS n=1 Tax=Novosphingobium marinum TaxID=1514948 RepID=A0A7Y9XXL5_9SPHN|nr:flagellar protein FliS [Novosphingobium marinum]NYH94978.1 flagellar protein FliS [Novosphingobium marinum]GGC41099.1 hypothetical protein GCM10011371_30690 [Novosphingobium marinum]